MFSFGRQLDLDDLSAKIDHQSGGLWSGQPLGEIEYANPFKNLFGTTHGCLH